MNFNKYKKNTIKENRRMKLIYFSIRGNFFYLLYFLLFIVFSEFFSSINQYFIFFQFLLTKESKNIKNYLIQEEIH